MIERNKDNLHIRQFDFTLPKDRIAHYPLPERSASRLLCLNKTDASIEHCLFNGLPELLSPNDLLIFNDTRVIPARLYGHKVNTGGQVELLIERILNTHTALAHVKTSRRLQPNANLQLDKGIMATVTERQPCGLFKVIIDHDRPSMLDLLDTIGHIPLPPYITRPDTPIDQKRYQTIYAKHKGAIAAPTAGLHFDKTLF